MARKPQPWFWKARRAWFVTIDGQRHYLGDDKKRAYALFHQLMAHPQKRRVRSDTLVVVIDAYLDWCHKHRALDTYEWYRQRLQCFAEMYPDLRTIELQPYHVQKWLDGMEGIASGTRRNYCRAIKRVLRWAEQQGYLERNPIAHLEQPKAGKRETVLSQADFDALLDQIPDRAFRDLLITTWDTGCRPQESLRVEARNVDLVNSRWIFSETEGKGGVLRIVYLTDRAAEITRRLMNQFPDGRLFRNSRGVAWRTDSVNCAFLRLQNKMGRLVMKERGLDVLDDQVDKLATSLAKSHRVKGHVVAKSDSNLRVEARLKLRSRLARSLAPKYSLYALRHSWATHALEKGLDALTVAILMGHRDPSTLAKVYQHLAHNPGYLLAQARRAVS